MLLGKTTLISQGRDREKLGHSYRAFLFLNCSLLKPSLAVPSRYLSACSFSKLLLALISITKVKCENLRQCSNVRSSMESDLHPGHELYSFHFGVLYVSM